MPGLRSASPTSSRVNCPLVSVAIARRLYARGREDLGFAPVKLERFNAGWMSVPAGIVRRGDDADRAIRLPVPVYLIETETERILVDTGLHPAAVADRAPLRPAGRVRPVRARAGRVDRRPGRPGTLTMVVLTHLHFDHAGGLASSARGPGRDPADRMGQPARTRRRRAQLLPAARLRRDRAGAAWSTATTTCSATAPWSCC